VRWNLEGGVAVITGAASGIGRALAGRLASEGMSLALVDVDALGLEQTAGQLGAARKDVSTYVVDVADAKAVQLLSRDVLERHRRVTLLINNAGVGLLGTFEELSIEEFDWLMRINFWGVIHGVHYFLPLLRREPHAHIANVSSIFGILASAGNSAYCASKFAVRGFTEALQHELEGTTVGVSCVHPGKIRTQISRNARISSKTSETRVEHPAGFTSSEEAANRIVTGIIRGERRILIGPDAVLFDKLQRALPVRYDSVLSSLRRVRKNVLNLSAVRPLPPARKGT
jgi:short-subunit dehydrogenase